MKWDPDAATEEESSYDGAFSYASEFHAFFIGLAVGLTSVLAVPKAKQFTYDLVGLGSEKKRSTAMQEARKESWYALGGMILGMGLGFAVQLALAYAGLRTLV